MTANTARSTRRGSYALAAVLATAAVAGCAGKAPSSAPSIPDLPQTVCAESASNASSPSGPSPSPSGPSPKYLPQWLPTGLGATRPIEQTVPAEGAATCRYAELSNKSDDLLTMTAVSPAPQNALADIRASGEEREIGDRKVVLSNADSASASAAWIDQDTFVTIFAEEGPDAVLAAIEATDIGSPGAGIVSFGDYSVVRHGLPPLPAYDRGGTRSFTVSYVAPPISSPGLPAHGITLKGWTGLLPQSAPSIAPQGMERLSINGRTALVRRLPLETGGTTTLVTWRPSKTVELFLQGDNLPDSDIVRVAESVHEASAEQWQNLGAG